MVGKRLELGLFWTFRYHLLRMLSKGLELEENLILQLVVSRRRLDLVFFIVFWNAIKDITIC